MAFAGLFRSVTCRGMAYPAKVFTNASKLGVVGSSPSFISTHLVKSSLKNQPTLSGPYLQPIRIKQVQFFSVTPKSYSAGAGHDHSTMWTAERVVSTALILILPAALIAPSKSLDTLAAATLVLHSFWGIEAMVTDYVRPILFGNIAPKIAMGGVFLLAFLTMAGLLQLIYTDVGLANTVKKIWRL